LNLELVDWSNQGFNLWKEVSGTINLVPGQATYTLPITLITVTDLWFRIVDPSISGESDTDRYMVSLTRQEYAAIPNKNTQSWPTSYWFQRLLIPQVTLYQVPVAGAPSYVCMWNGLAQIQDANVGNAETPDVPYRAYEALCACMAKRLAEKFAPSRLAEKTALATQAFGRFAMNDSEIGVRGFYPNVSPYTRI
jgi:hypothetical protein